MEKLKKAIDKLSDAINTCVTREDSDFTEVYSNLIAVQKEVAELEKIQNYTKASTTPVKKEVSKKEMVNHHFTIKVLK